MAGKKKAATQEIKIDALKRCNQMLYALYGPVPTVQALMCVPGLEVQASKLESQLKGTIPLLREIVHELATQLDVIDPDNRIE